MCKANLIWLYCQNDFEALQAMIERNARHIEPMFTDDCDLDNREVSVHMACTRHLFVDNSYAVLMEHDYLQSEIHLYTALHEEIGQIYPR